MVDESIDISTMKHLIFYVTYIECGCVKTSYLGIVNIGDSGAANAYGDGECATQCMTIDKLVNKVAAYFSKSSKRLAQLMEIEMEHDYTKLKLQRIQDTRWLSRGGAFSKFCECLELVAELFKRSGKLQLYNKLKTLKNMYVLHFLADVLQVMSSLNQKFQEKLIDITMVGPLCRETIVKLNQYYISDEIDLNGNPIDGRSYPHILDGGSKDGFLHALRASIKGDAYRTMQLIRSEDGSDLQGAVQFQISFTSTLIAAIRQRLQDIGILSKMQVLALVNLPILVKENK
ncbi:hypothetical protein SELMODRAFT_411462 [Selaginella moellendorffii]|uniref:DUF4371 domain-containing protein n=1 Tax=Selaginella moellendorffii TaxID=88036 RepID=D8RI10_SELML|nr:hypothetical protein SELMODRAFT_411462 [Selaginella moellendorffii]